MREKNNKVALVTGGTGGMGTAICERLYKDGYSVVANYRNFTTAMKWREMAKKWRDDQLQMGIDVKIVQGDVTNYQSATIMIKKIEDEVGPVDVLVNNVGISRDATVRKMTPEQWYEVINTNLNSVFICSRLVINQMVEKKWGRIICISSVNGHKGSYGTCNYSSSKAGMYGFVKTIAMEVVKYGITANTISPGYTATPMLTGIPDEVMQKIIAQVPMGRLAQPREIAAAVAYLASDEAAFMTGADISINGGQYMY
ncbi:MAG: acetoacetyl-CoA reductase [Bacteroidetes bacterium]|nr:acetoacetyl-CoA reductase [Bacteroidota bacterium]